LPAGFNALLDGDVEIVAVNPDVVVADSAPAESVEGLLAGLDAPPADRVVPLVPECPSSCLLQEAVEAGVRGFVVRDGRSTKYSAPSGRCTPGGRGSTRPSPAGCSG
jgi:hypothetical protein